MKIHMNSPMILHCFYKKGHNTIEPLLLELYEGAEESYLAFENGNSNKF